MFLPRASYLVGHLMRAEKEMHSEIDEPSTSPEFPFTRSSISPLNNSLYFFVK